MATKKAPITLLKEAEKRIEELEKQLESEKITREMYRTNSAKAEHELESVHAALDAMFVPRSVKNGYSNQTMTVASRLFAWLSGARIENTKREID